MSRSFSRCLVEARRWTAPNAVCIVTLWAMFSMVMLLPCPRSQSVKCQYEKETYARRKGPSADSVSPDNCSLTLALQITSRYPRPASRASDLLSLSLKLSMKPFRQQFIFVLLPEPTFELLVSSFLLLRTLSTWVVLSSFPHWHYYVRCFIMTTDWILGARQLFPAFFSGHFTSSTVFHHYFLTIDRNIFIAHKISQLYGLDIGHTGCYVKWD